MRLRGEGRSRWARDVQMGVLNFLPRIPDMMTVVVWVWREW